MNKWWLKVVAFVLVMSGAMAWAEEPRTFTLTLTDGNAGVMQWIQAVLIFALDSEEKVTAFAEVGIPFDLTAIRKEPVAQIVRPSDPVRLSLPEGDYVIVISVLRYGEDLIVISLGRVKLVENTTFDIRQVRGIPYDLFVPC